MEITEKTITDAWKKSLKYILDYGVDFKDTDNRMCREVTNMVVIVENPQKDYDRPIALMQEFEWIYPTKEELTSIILSRESSAITEYSYGARIFDYLKTIDQINDFIIPLLKKDKFTRRAVISLYNPITDSNLFSKNIPSIMFIHFKIKEGLLNITCFIRSNDFFIGWPGNIYQIFMLQQHVAEKLGIGLGSLTTISSSAHVFHEHFEMARKIIGVIQ